MEKDFRALKLIIVGSCGVGKTSMIVALQKKQFSYNMNPTISPSSYNTKFPVSKDVEITLQIWDTAGQEKYQSISRMFYRDADICFIVYDENTISTVEQWAEIVREDVPSAIIFLVQTKSDLLDLNSGDCIQAGQQLKKKNNFREYFLVSSLTGQGIYEVFLAAAMTYKDILQKDPISFERNQKTESGCC